jgi:two-component system nitrate/nitrite response regulator NarL
MGDRIRVAIVDDHPLFREGVAHTLAGGHGIEIVGQGASADDALQLARDLLPDVILLDISMPGGGLNAAREIAAACPATRIVMLTVSEEDDLLAALKAGARAYALKGVSGRELASILRAVHAGEVYVTPTLASSLLFEMTRAPKSRPIVNPLDELTERERQILELVAAGHSNREVGSRLYLTEKTVKHYMTNILHKLQVRNRVEAALLAQKAVQGEPRTS